MKNNKNCTYRIYLASLKKSSIPILFKWINDKEDVLFNAPYRAIPMKEHLNWFRSITKKRKDLIIYGIYLKDSNKLIGTCQLHSISPLHNNAELQIRIGDKKERNKGYGTEVVKLLIDFAFDKLHLHRIHLHVFSTNSRAIRTYEKNGFIKEGLLREAALINNQYIDIMLMGILNKK